MCSSDLNAAFKYLGIRLTVKGGTEQEILHVQQTMGAMAKKLRFHPYKHRQANAMIRVAAHPVFTYSSTVAAWSHQRLRDLGSRWGLMSKRAWGLTDGHNSAPFLLPKEEGGVQKNSPIRLGAKQATTLTERLIKALDGDVRRLANDEWDRLMATWGSGRTNEVQLMLMLEETSKPRTLFAPKWGCHDFRRMSVSGSCPAPPRAPSTSINPPQPP